MKTFKKFIKEASGFPTGPVGENPKNLAGEVTDTLGSDVFNPQNLKRINAIIALFAGILMIIILTFYTILFPDQDPLAHPYLTTVIGTLAIFFTGILMRYISAKN